MTVAVPVATEHSDGSRKPGGSREFRPDIQGLRAIAVAMVVIYHLYPSVLPGGFAGVDVFFVISGYLITGQLWRGYAQTGKAALADFWGRRARRLIPAAALVLTVTWIASRVIEPATQFADTAQQILASALYYQNWQLSSDAVDYFKSGDAATPVQHFWSLSVEEQFYVVWPLLFLLAAFLTATFASRPEAAKRRAAAAGRAAPVLAGTALAGTALAGTALAGTALAGTVPAGTVPAGTVPAGTGRTARRTRARGTAVVVLMAALVIASLAYSVHETNASAPAYFMTTTRMWELGAGGLLALAPARLTRALARQGWLGWCGLALVIESAFLLSGSMAFPGTLALIPVLGAVGLIAGGSAQGRYGPSRLTSARLMVFIGGISYSLYLWHYPLINLYTGWRGKAPGLLSGPVILAVCVLLAWLTKVFVEDKVRLAPFIAGHKWRSLAVALVAVVPVTLAGVYIAGEPGPWNGTLGPDYPGAAVLAGTVAFVPAAPVLKPPDPISQTLDQTGGCLNDFGASTPTECVFGDTANPVLTVALVGDSSAMEWFDALNAIAVRRHWKLVTELHSSCPWTPTLLLNWNGIGELTACQAWGAAVLHDLTTTIRPNVVITTDYPSLLSTPGHPVNASPAAMAEIGAGMAQYWTRLEAAGISVTPIRETPDLVEDVPTCVDQHPTDLARCDVPVSAAILPDSPVTDAAQLMNGKVTVVNANSLICGPKTCAPVVGNVLVFGDRHHLTGPYSTSTAPFLEVLLLKASKPLDR